MSQKITFVLGGAASGKSAFAETLCLQSAKPRLYWATAQIFDAEMEDKIRRHLQQRGADWTTIEDPRNADAALAQATEGDILLFDCATMWLSNHLLAESDLDAEVTGLLAALGRCAAEVVIVSNEVGQSVVPENALARRFREAQGRLNIRLAALADCVVQVTAGLPLVLKGSL